MAQDETQSAKPEAGKEAEDVLVLARERFQRCVEFESENREKQRDDIKFVAASPDDPWQWPEAAIKERESSGRPCLTINKLPQHTRQVTNDIRQNRPSIKYRAANDKAAPEVAEIWTGIARHIEANSDADVAYDTAAEHAVDHGLGYIRVLTDYVSDESFDQDIFIRRVRDPFKVYLDPACEDPAGADAQFGFIEETLQEDEYKSQYPKADAIDWDFQTSDWYSKGEKTVRVAEYFAIERRESELLMWTNGATSFKGDQLPMGVFPIEAPIKRRPVKRAYLCWRKVTGNQVLEKREYKWKYVPIARVLGNEKLVDGKHVVSGIVRNAKDAQRMYNVAQSAITERIMLAPKAPWAVAEAAIEGHEDKWQTANTANLPYLPYNHVDDQGQPIPPPVRVQPATVEPGLQQVLMAASDDIKATTGQFDASMGQRSNETSGKAIMARQREGDTATYHYIDNLARAVRHIGRIILDIAPTVFDAPRIARMLGEDGTEDFARVDPALPQAYQEAKDEQGKTHKFFNPNVGLYDVVVSTGPSFTTRRVEAFEAMSQMTQANPMLWQVIGDQLVRNMDWPGAEDMAERLKVTLLPQVQQMLGEQGEQTQIPPQVQMQIEQMGQQLQQLGQALQEASAEADKTRNEGKKLDIEAYKARTERMSAIAPAIPQEMVQAIVMQTVQQIIAPQPMQQGMPEHPAMQIDDGPPLMDAEWIDQPTPLDMSQGMPPEQAFAPQEPQGF
jgi:hypothetical protein